MSQAENPSSLNQSCPFPMGHQHVARQSSSLTFCNNLALIIKGVGTRTAESFDGSATQAPVLRIEFSNPTSMP